MRVDGWWYALEEEGRQAQSFFTNKNKKKKDEDKDG